MLVDIRHLTKTYGKTIACQDICLFLEKGQIFGLLGPNGAGKSTLVKMLVGLVKPSGGSAFIHGIPVSDTRMRKDIGYLPELFRLYPWLTAVELLRFYARWYQVPAPQEQLRIEEALDITGLRGRESEKIEGYSKGMQQRLALAGAILHRPELLFLDEPTSAMDPLGRRDVRDIIHRMRDQGTTIFLNSHLLGEVEMTCNHVAFINHGRLIASGPIGDFIQKNKMTTIEIGNMSPGLLDDWQRKHQFISYSGGTLCVSAGSKEAVAAIVAELVQQGAAVYGVHTKTDALESVFMDLIERQED